MQQKQKQRKDWKKCGRGAVEEQLRKKVWCKYTNQDQSQWRIRSRQGMYKKEEELLCNTQTKIEIQWRIDRGKVYVRKEDRRFDRTPLGGRTKERKEMRNKKRGRRTRRGGGEGVFIPRWVISKSLSALIFTLSATLTASCHWTEAKGEGRANTANNC